MIGDVTEEVLHWNKKRTRKRGRERGEGEGPEKINAMFFFWPARILLNKAAACTSA